MRSMSVLRRSRTSNGRQHNILRGSASGRPILERTVPNLGGGAANMGSAPTPEEMTVSNGEISRGEDGRGQRQHKQITIHMTCGILMFLIAIHGTRIHRARGSRPTPTGTRESRRSIGEHKRSG